MIIGRIHIMRVCARKRGVCVCVCVCVCVNIHARGVKADKIINQ